MTKKPLNNPAAPDDQPPAMVLLFGPFNPSGSSNLPADAITCSTLGAHPLAALTAVRVQDTANIEDVQEVSPELIDDQARCLLEDMNIQAIKVGPLYTVDSVRVIAQIAADYSEVPLLLHLGPSLEHHGLDDSEPEDVLGAVFELLLPAASLVLTEYSLLAHWHADGLLSSPDDTGSALTESSENSPAHELIQYGAQWVLIAGAPIRPGQLGYLLFGPENASSSWPSTINPKPPHDQYGPLGCALTVQMAHGLPVPQAVETAIQLAAPLSAMSFRPGMGQRILRRSK